MSKCLQLSLDGFPACKCVVMDRVVAVVVESVAVQSKVADEFASIDKDDDNKTNRYHAAKRTTALFFNRR